MLKNNLKNVFIYLLLSIMAISALARSPTPPNTWGQQGIKTYNRTTVYQNQSGYRPANSTHVQNQWGRPNNTYVQNQWGQPNNTYRGQVGYKAAAGYQPQPQWNRFNQSHGQNYNNPSYVNTQPGYNQPSASSMYTTVRPMQPNPSWPRNNQTQYYPQPSYGNQFYPSQPNGGGIRNNQTQYYPQPTNNNQGYASGQIRPANTTSYQPSAPVGLPANSQPYQPSAPAALPANSHLYPILSNSGYNSPQQPANSWTPGTQPQVYPQLQTTRNPNAQPPYSPPASSGGIPLAPLQPQGPDNWHSGGQAALSYGQGQYQQPSGNPYNNQQGSQGNTNPYAPMFH